MASEGNGQRFALVYRLTREDAAAFVDLPSEYSTSAKLAMFLPLFLFGVLGGWFAEQLGWDIGSWNWLQEGLALGAMIVLWFACVTAVLTIRRYRRVARFPLPPAEARLVADGAGVTLDEGRGEERWTWSDVPWVATGRQHVFLQTAARKAIILPLRAFEDEPAMQRFGAFAEAASRAADE
jgi:hypothetical protein